MQYLDKNTALNLLGLEKIDHSVVISDPGVKDCPMIYVSNEFANQTGYNVKEALGKNCRFLQGPETDPNDVEHIRQAIKMKTSITIDILNYKKNGDRFWNRLRIRPLFGPNGKIIFFAREQNPIKVEDVRRYTFNKIIE